tara:strand:+ start:176 stop:388 length:213 start_codon:yes stop_codon:yes gene_type:complete
MTHYPVEIYDVMYRQHASGKIKLVPLICFWKRDNAEISLATMPRGVGEIVPRTVDEDVAFETCEDRWEEP